MAYMNQEKKKSIEPAVKAICKRHGLKATLSVNNHSTLVLTIAEGRIDFFGDRVPARWSQERLAEPATHLDVNPYHWKEEFDGAALAFLAEVFPALNEGNHDRSDSMTDYFDVGWYVEVKVGNWDKPYRQAGTPPARETAGDPVAYVLSAAKVIAAAQPDPRPTTAGFEYADRAKAFAAYVATRETEETLARDAAAPQAELAEVPAGPARPQLRLVHDDTLLVPHPFPMAPARA